MEKYVHTINDDIRNRYDDDGISYKIEVGYTSFYFDNAETALDFAKTCVTNTNHDIEIQLIRVCDMFTGEKFPTFSEYHEKEQNLSDTDLNEDN